MLILWISNEKILKNSNIFIWLNLFRKEKIYNLEKIVQDLMNK